MTADILTRYNAAPGCTLCHRPGCEGTHMVPHGQPHPRDIAETIWTAAARRVPVLDQLDRTAPLKPMSDKAKAAYRARLDAQLRPFQRVRPRHRP